MGFWTNNSYLYSTSTTDSVNDEIWANSASVQTAINAQLYAPGCPCQVGAQQAMLDCLVHPTIAANLMLPWVPDLLGSKWTDEAAVTILGPSYASFIEGYTTRTRRLTVSDYLSAVAPGRWQDFQREFVANVVIGDASYYEKLVPILSLAPGHGAFSVFDLCCGFRAMKIIIPSS